jgi:hypothetical protein
MLVFKDALDLIRAACGDNDDKCHMENKNSWLLKNPEEAINHCLRKASNFLMHSTKNVVLDTGKKLTILTDDQSPASAFDLTQNLFDNMNIYAVRINENKSADDVCSLEIEVAIILYNFATAYLHHVETLELGGTILFHGPLRFFYLSLEVLSRDPNFVLEKVGYLEAMRMLVISTLVVKSLMHLSWRLNLGSDAKGYYDKLRCLHAAFFQLQRVPCLSMLSAVSHSSAA